MSQCKKGKKAKEVTGESNENESESVKIYFPVFARKKCGHLTENIKVYNFIVFLLLTIEVFFMQLYYYVFISVCSPDS